MIAARQRLMHEALQQPGDFQYQDLGYHPIDDPRPEFPIHNYARVAFACPQTGKPCANGAGILIGFPDKPNSSRGWRWDGNLVQPTLEPSINCGGCGWHGYLHKGQFCLPAERC